MCLAGGEVHFADRHPNLRRGFFDGPRPQILEEPRGASSCETISDLVSSQQFNPDRWLDPSHGNIGLEVHGLENRLCVEHYKFIPFSLGMRCYLVGRLRMPVCICRTTHVPWIQFRQGVALPAGPCRKSLCRCAHHCASGGGHDDVFRVATER